MHIGLIISRGERKGRISRARAIEQSPAQPKYPGPFIVMNLEAVLHCLKEGAQTADARISQNREYDMLNKISKQEAIANQILESKIKSRTLELP